MGILLQFLIDVFLLGVFMFITVYFFKSLTENKKY
jgi:hypothetical protein